jgi:biotin operon repressor
MSDDRDDSKIHIVSGGGRPSLSGLQLDEMKRREIDTFRNNQLFIMKYLYEKRIEKEYRADDDELGKYLQINSSDVWKHIRYLAEDTGNNLIKVHRFNSGRGIETKYSITATGITAWEQYMGENATQILLDIQDLQQQGNVRAKELDLEIIKL